MGIVLAACQLAPDWLLSVHQSGHVQCDRIDWFQASPSSSQQHEPSATDTIYNTKRTIFFAILDYKYYSLVAT